MMDADDRDQRIQSLQECLSRLSEASLNITEGLDAVLQGGGRGALPDRGRQGMHHRRRRVRAVAGLPHLRRH